MLVYVCGRVCGLTSDMRTVGGLAVMGGDAALRPTAATIWNICDICY